MKLTRNAYKRKIILFGVLIFASIALISTGFAAWVMSSDAKESAGGNVSVGLVTDSSLTITIDNKTQFEAFTYKFEPLASDNTGRVRYDGSNAEALTFTVTGSIGNHEILAENGFTVKMEVPAGIKAAADAEYIVLPACVDTPAVISVNGEGKFSYTIEFKWGEAFGTKNPGLYFDEGNVALAGDPAYVPDAAVKEHLENLRAYVYGYYEEMTASGADRQAVIAAHAGADMPTFNVEFVAKAN